MLRATCFKTCFSSYPSRTLTARRLASAQRSFVTSSVWKDKDGLHGSAGPHARHLVLFTGRDYATIPSHIDSVSPLYTQIVQRMQDADSPLRSYALAVTDSSASHTLPPKTAWSGSANRFDRPSDNTEKEAYGAVVYPDRVEVPFAIDSQAITTKTLETFLQDLPSSAIADQATEQVIERDTSQTSSEEVDVFVCTHGQRDCRCGDVGSAFYEALVSEARHRRLGHAAQSFKEGSGPIRIHKTTHIGGHRFAATCFTSTGDWYGLLSPLDAPGFLNYLLKKPDPNKPLAHIWWDKWRGRAGLAAEAQKALAHVGMQQKTSSMSALEAAREFKRQRKKHAAVLGDPVELVFHRHDGEKVPVRAFKGETLMEAAKRHELVEATCGGACECATCHLYLVPASDSVEAPVPETSDEEEDQLEYAIGGTDDSRLACQVVITDQLVGWLDRGGTLKLPRY